MLRFRPTWQLTAQKNGVIAIELPRVLRLGSYNAAWTVLQNCLARWCDRVATDWAGWRDAAPRLIVRVYPRRSTCTENCRPTCVALAESN